MSQAMRPRRGSSAFGASVAPARPSGHAELMAAVLQLDDAELDVEFPAPVDVALPDGLPYWRAHVRATARRAVNFPHAHITEPYRSTSRLRGLARRPVLDPAGPPLTDPKDHR